MRRSFPYDRDKLQIGHFKSQLLTPIGLLHCIMPREWRFVPSSNMEDLKKTVLFS